MVLLTGLNKSYLVFALPMVGFAIGAFLDRQETLRMVRFRDKSALYGKQLPAGAPPSWP